jgi:hypothetical protein
LSETFLKALVAEIGSPQKSNRGPTGPQGRPGLPGTGDGPSGDPGQPGKDNLNPANLAAIEFVDTDDIVDEAVIDVKITAGNRLLLTKAKIKVSSDDTPADSAVALPIVRTVQFPDTTDLLDPSTLDDWELTQPGDDGLPDDVTLALIPRGTVDGAPVQLAPYPLTLFISDVIDWFKYVLNDYDLKWRAEVKALMEEKDAAAKAILDDLTQQLTLCEFNTPPDLCVQAASPFNTTNLSSFLAPMTVMDVGGTQWKITN